MVYLNRIYTKSGDTGETSLGSGERVPKTHLRIAAYGCVDELNSVLGVVLAQGSLSSVHQQRLLIIQNDLFDLGADLCVPQSDPPRDCVPLRMTADQVARLEQWIDDATNQLQPLNSFILPGGTTAAAFLHLARTVCRRAEIEVLHLAAQAELNPQALIYLNRLSDLLFVLARMENDQGRGDILWVPGRERSNTLSGSTDRT